MPYLGDDAVIIDGHRVDPGLAERFYSGKDGSRLTDEQWDETQRRIHEAPEKHPLEIELEEQG